MDVSISSSSSSRHTGRDGQGVEEGEAKVYGREAVDSAGLATDARRDSWRGTALPSRPSAEEHPAGRRRPPPRSRDSSISAMTRMTTLPRRYNKGKRKVVCTAIQNKALIRLVISLRSLRKHGCLWTKRRLHALPCPPRLEFLRIFPRNNQYKFLRQPLGLLETRRICRVVRDIVFCSRECLCSNP